MKKVDIEQDTSEWLEERRKSIGGSDAHSILPPTRGAGAADGRTATFWEKVAAQLTKQKDAAFQDERDMDRGHRLEAEAINELSTIVGLPFDTKPGIWKSDDYLVHISVDGAEPTDIPTYDAEVKALKAGKHFKYLYKSLKWKSSQLDLVPNEYGAYYREQVLHAFAVNPLLETRFFMLYEPNAIYEEHKVVLIVIRRKDIQEELTDYSEVLNKVTTDIRNVVAELAGNQF